MVRIRLLLAAILAALSIAAVGSATAYAAHEFKVEGKTVTGNTVELHGSLLAHKQVLKGKLAGITAEVECLHILGLGLINGKKVEGKLEYKECELLKPKKCPAIIKNLSVNGELVGEEGKPNVLVTSKLEKELFTELTFEKCSGVEGPFSIEGSQECELPKASTELVEHSVVCKTTGSKLKFGGSAATYEGEVPIWVVNSKGEKTGEKWSAR